MLNDASNVTKNVIFELTVHVQIPETESLDWEVPRNILTPQ